MNNSKYVGKQEHQITFMSHFAKINFKKITKYLLIPNNQITTRNYSHFFFYYLEGAFGCIHH